jgi:imidazolonepropionase-like amidohydrolase
VTTTITAFCAFFTSLLMLASALGMSDEKGQQPQTQLIITQVTVIDATGAPAKPDMTVVITNGCIAALGNTREVPLPKDARVLNGSGKFLIPGLWDMHGHLTYAGESALALVIENGTTGVRDLGGDLEQIDLWRREITSGRRLGPHIVRAGPFVDGLKPHLKDRLTVTNAAEARRAVDTLKLRGVDFIKVHNGLSRESFFAVADQARKRGIPLAVHLPSGLWTKPRGDGVSVAEASDAGAKSLEHVEILLESALYRKGATAKTIEEAIAENSGEAGAALFARLVRNRTWYVPTLVAYYRGFVLSNDNPKDTEGRREIHFKNLKLVQAMHKAGVEIMAGSDFSDWALVPGVDLHNELALFVEAGFTPMEALQSATIKPAKFLGKLDSLGTIEKGKIADLVLLDANPLEDISHTRKINSVIIGGKLVPISKLRDQFLNPAVAR